MSIFNIFGSRRDMTVPTGAISMVSKSYYMEPSVSYEGTLGYSVMAKVTYSNGFTDSNLMVAFYATKEQAEVAIAHLEGREIPTTAKTETVKTAKATKPTLVKKAGR